MRSGIKDYRISQIGMREPKILVLVVNGLSLSYETLQDLKAALQLATTNMESAAVTPCGVFAAIRIGRASAMPCTKNITIPI